MSTVALTFAIALATVLTTAALHKLRAGERFAAQLAAYQLLPEAWPLSTLRRVGLGLAAVELLLAAALLVPPAWPLAATGTAALLALYLAAMAVNLLRGRHQIDCGCGDQPQPLSAALLARNLVLIFAALLIALAEQTAGLRDCLVALPASVVLVLIYTAAEQLLANASVLVPREAPDE